MLPFLETRRKRARLSYLLLTLSLGASICADNVVIGQSELGSDKTINPAYRISVSEVRIVFFADDDNNRIVQDLRKDDFAVVDDERVIRDFRSFTRSHLTKLDVVVLIDSSDSVLPHFRQETADVLQLISQLPWSPEDNVSVLSFGDTEVRPINPSQPSNGTGMLRWLADDSGGRCFRIGEGAARIFNDVLDDLHSARVVTYASPPSSSDFHPIRILPTHNLNLKFRCRRGYYRPVNSAPQEKRP